MDAKLGRIVIYLERLLHIKSHHCIITWCGLVRSCDKLEKIYIH